jgi:hypothetical protein
MAQYIYDMALVHVHRIHQDILVSPISGTLVGVTARGSGNFTDLADLDVSENAQVVIEFEEDLSASDETILDGLVANHVPEEVVKTHSGRFCNTLHVQKAGVPYTIEIPTGKPRAGAFKANMSDNQSSNVASINPIAYTDTGFVVEVVAQTDAQPMILDFAWEIERR